ncbi:MAG: Hsp20 family protein [Alphaproteobacteria bacterium]|jgi:molecular chaperone IbpA
MRSFDLTPLYRSTVGFDRLFSMLDQATGAEGPTPGYPPYNIEKTGETAYRITLAVAGFSADELTLDVREQTLAVRGEKAPADAETKREFLHQGIAARAFERRFQLADHVVVKGASMEHGLLHVDLVREIPEALKPRHIPITTNASGSPRVIEGKVKKAA